MGKRTLFNGSSPTSFFHRFLYEEEMYRVLYNFLRNTQMMKDFFLEEKE